MRSALSTTNRIPSLAWRLGAGFTLSFLVVAALVAALQLLLTQRFGSFVTRQSMAGQSEDLIEGLRFGPDGQLSGVQLEPIDAYAYDAFYANLQYRVLDAQGRVVASSNSGGASLLPHVPLAQQGGHYEVRAVDGVTFHLAAWRHEVRGQPLILQLARSDRFAELAREAVTPAVTETIGLLAVLAAVVFSLVGVIVVRTTLRPIRRAARTASRVGGSNLAERLPLDEMPREIRPLIEAFNSVLDRLQAAFVEQQRFFANAAHELKTPIALLRGQVEAGGRDDAAPLLRDVDMLGRLVQQLLQIAELSGGPGLRLQPMSPGPTLDAAVDYLAWHAEQRQVTLRIVHPAEAVQVRADAGALFVLAKNLIDNAIGCSPAGGVVGIVLDASGFHVDDQGPGVPEAERELVFERFWRAAGQSRDGAGLGLSICRDIARASGWRIDCGSAPGGGARFRVQFDARSA